MTAAPSSTWEPRRIGIVGAGAMGISLAAIVGRIAPVILVCRSAERAASLFAHGARTTGLIRAESRPIVVRSAEELRAVGGVSAIFVATKTTAIPSVAADLRAAGPETLGDGPGSPVVVSYQNGFESGRQLAKMLGSDRVLRMVLGFGAVMRPGSPDVVVTLSSPPHIIGCIRPEHRPACESLAALLTRAGLETRFDERIERRVWMKGIVNAAVNPVAALANATVGQVLDAPARTIIDRLLLEAIAVADAEGLGLDESFLDQARRSIEQARDHTPSMVEDIRAGRESEVGQLNRQVIEHARRLGVPVPTHEVIDALIETFDWKVYRAGAAAPVGDAAPADRSR